MRQRQRRMRLEIGIVLALALGACSDGRWQSESSADTTPRTVEVVRASSLVVPSARFILVVFDAGHRAQFGLRLKHDENLIRAKLVLRLVDRDGEQDCSLEAACRVLYMEESDISSGLIPLNMRGTVTLKRNRRGHHLSAHLRILPKDEGDHSQRFVGSDGSFLGLDLNAVTVRDDPRELAEMGSWREQGGTSRLREWHDEITKTTTPKP